MPTQVATSSSDVGDSTITTTLPHLPKGGILMVKCSDCCNLVKSWKPTAKRDWLFEEQWKCKATDETFEKYYLIEKGRECKNYEKRPKLVLQSIE